MNGSMCATEGIYPRADMAVYDGYLLSEWGTEAVVICRENGTPLQVRRLCHPRKLMHGPTAELTSEDTCLIGISVVVRERRAEDGKMVPVESSVRIYRVTVSAGDQMNAQDVWMGFPKEFPVELSRFAEALSAAIRKTGTARGSHVPLYAQGYDLWTDADRWQHWEALRRF